MFKEQTSSFHSHMHPNVRKNETSKQRRIDTDSMCKHRMSADKTSCVCVRMHQCIASLACSKLVNNTVNINTQLYTQLFLNTIHFRLANDAQSTLIQRRDEQPASSEAITPVSHMPNRNSFESIHGKRKLKVPCFWQTTTTINSLRSQAVMREPSFYNPRFYGLCMWRL